MQDAMTCTLTIYFDGTFWVGSYERVHGGKLEVATIVFGAEPKDYEVYAYFNKNWHKLRFSAPLHAQNRTKHKANPKRMQRAISQQLSQVGMSTKAQEALRLQQEQNKLIRKKKSKEQREAEKQALFELRQQKKKQKHKGH